MTTSQPTQPKLSALLSQLQAANARLVRIETRQAVMMLQMGLDPQKVTAL